MHSGANPRYIGENPYGNWKNRVEIEMCENVKKGPGRPSKP
jgi:hypothetical protein